MIRSDWISIEKYVSGSNHNWSWVNAPQPELIPSLFKNLAAPHDCQRTGSQIKNESSINLDNFSVEWIESSQSFWRIRIGERRTSVLPRVPTGRPWLSFTQTYVFTSGFRFTHYVLASTGRCQRKWPRPSKRISLPSRLWKKANYTPITGTCSLSMKATLHHTLQTLLARGSFKVALN